MPICRKCKGNIAKNLVSCNSCRNSFHPGCLANFVSAKTPEHCCRQTYDLTTGTTRKPEDSAAPVRDSESVPSPSADQRREEAVANAGSFASTTLSPAPFANPALTKSRSEFCLTDNPLNSVTTLTSPARVAPARPQNKRQISPPSPSVTPVQKQSREEAHASTSSSADSPDSPLLGPVGSGVTMAEQMPAWFKVYYDDYKADKIARDTKLNTIEARVNESSAQHAADMAEVRAELAAARQNSTNEDTCEAIFSGLPATLLDTQAAATRVLTAINLPALASFITRIRPWHPRDPRSNNREAASQEPATMAIVVKFVSPSIRDDVIRNANLLETFSSQTLFGSGGATRIYLNALYPKDVYRLRAKAFRVAKEKGYDRPIVKNLVVCMRATRDSPLIPVYSDADLAALAPRRN